jgi:hypothetical protein
MVDDSSPGAGDGQLWQLVYSSAASPGFDLAALQNVLRVARERNAREDITGMLLFEGKSFLQILEGECATIDALLESIRHDPRHSRVVLLLREKITARSFGDWTMGYAAVTLGQLADAIGTNDFFLDRAAFADLDSAKVTRVLDLFREGSFRQRLT